MFVVIDKFTKWIEARPITTASSESAIEFINKIIHQYDVMNTIITDNGTQFTGSEFVDFYDEQQINMRWASVAHPRTNRQVERANGSILRGLKPQIFRKLKKFRGRWVQELQPVFVGLMNNSYLAHRVHMLLPHLWCRRRST